MHAQHVLPIPESPTSTRPRAKKKHSMEMTNESAAGDNASADKTPDAARAANVGKSVAGPVRKGTDSRGVPMTAAGTAVATSPDAATKPNNETLNSSSSASPTGDNVGRTGRNIFLSPILQRRRPSVSPPPLLTPDAALHPEQQRVGSRAWAGVRNVELATGGGAGSDQDWSDTDDPTEWESSDSNSDSDSHSDSGASVAIGLAATDPADTNSGRAEPLKNAHAGFDRRGIAVSPPFNDEGGRRRVTARGVGEGQGEGGFRDLIAPAETSETEAPETPAQHPGDRTGASSGAAATFMTDSINCTDEDRPSLGAVADISSPETFMAACGRSGGLVTPSPPPPVARLRGGGGGGEGTDSEQEVVEAGQGGEQGAGGEGEAGENEEEGWSFVGSSGRRSDNLGDQGDGDDGGGEVDEEEKERMIQWEFVNGYLQEVPRMGSTF